ncbi:efflux transporter outer membrane subunit [Anseongella ginsenosidimutans]|uniref:efflux transporter outer membrane subunit n=1 Tax=Anseongella ginsenosidimutans TaxID=496056 RepID=UPI003D79EBDE
MLYSCSVKREYQRPETELPGQFRTGSESGQTTPNTDSAGIARLEWKAFFTDSALQLLIDSVLSRNYDMQTAFNTVRLNAEFLKQARVAWLPTLNAGVQASTSRLSQNSLNGLNLAEATGSKHMEDYLAGLDLSWEIDIWNKTGLGKKAALANYLQSEAAVTWLKTRLIASTASAYYQLLTLHEQLTIAQRNLGLQDSTLRIMRLQHEAGQVSLLAVQQAEVQKETTAALIPELEQALMIQENALSILMAEEPQAIAVKSEPVEFSIPEELSAGVPAALLSYRPDVRASEYALQAADAEVGISQANRYPSLSITASGGLNAFKASSWFTTPASLFGTVAGNLVQPVFNHRRLKTEYEAAKIRRENAVIEFRSNVLQAVGEVSDALVQLTKLEEQIDRAQTRKTILEKAIPNARLLFNSGMATYLEVITAQQNALQNELSLTSLKRQRINAYILLYRSLGGA